jgi:hypothetical protein
MPLTCWICHAATDAAEPGRAVLCALHAEQYASLPCRECGVLQTALKSKISEICSVCTVGIQWPSLPAGVRAEFDRLLRQGHRIQAIKSVRDSYETEPKPSLHWLMDALVYRAKVLGLDA